MRFEAQEEAVYAGPTSVRYQYGTSSMYGSVMDRGTSDYSEWRRYPKGIRANTAGTAVLVDTSGGTTPFVMVAAETIFFKWKSIASTSSLTNGTSSINNFVIIWD